MNRRDFVRTAGAGGTWLSLSGSFGMMEAGQDTTWFDRPMRWAQLVLVENDPGNFDPDFWLNYFKEIHADAACLSA